MNTKNHMNFEYQDGMVSAHVRVTDFGRGRIVMSHHNTLRHVPYITEGFETVDEAMVRAVDLRLDAYNDIVEVLSTDVNATLSVLRRVHSALPHMEARIEIMEGFAVITYVVGGDVCTDPVEFKHRVGEYGVAGMTDDIAQLISMHNTNYNAYMS